MSCAALRTGRASPALVEDIRVDYYGSQTPIKSIASIAIPEATQLMIKPFSPQDMKAIEKAISDSKLGLTPHSDGRALVSQAPATLAGAASAAGRPVQVSTPRPPRSPSATPAATPTRSSTPSKRAASSPKTKIARQGTDAGPDQAIRNESRRHDREEAAGDHAGLIAFSTGAL